MADSPKVVTVPLEEPLERDAGELTELKFRRPDGRDFRGMSIAKLGQLDYDEVRTLAPRITMDGLIAEEFDSLSSADIIEVSLEFADFLQTKARREGSPTA